MSKLISVQFQQDPLLIVNQDDQPYIPMKPIVKGIGLDWSGQQVKFKASRQKFNYQDILIVAKDGKNRHMLCIPLKKLNGWLFSINPEKVKPEIREKVIAYQEECFQVLYDYWSKGVAVNPRMTITSEQQYTLQQVVHKRVGELLKPHRHAAYPVIWRKLKEKFHVPTYKDIQESQFEEAKQFLETVELSGEWLPAGSEKKPIVSEKSWCHYPAELAKPPQTVNDHGWFTIDHILSSDTPNFLADVIHHLEQEGHNVDAPKIQLYALYKAAKNGNDLRHNLLSTLNEEKDRGLSVRFEENGDYKIVSHVKPFFPKG